MLENGKYRGKARTARGTLIESSKGTPGITVEMGIADPAHAGAALTWTGWLSDSAFDRTIEALRLLGWTGADLENVDGLDANEVELVVEAEEYEGNWYPRIKYINRLGGALGAPMTADKAKTFASAMRDRIRALDAAKGTGRPAQAASGSRRAPAPSGDRRATPPSLAQPEPPPFGDDDIPF